MQRLVLAVLVSALLALTIWLPADSEMLEPLPLPSPSLWILTPSLALHHGGEDGALLERFRQLEEAESLVVDEGRGVVWVLSVEELTVWGLDGTERFRVPLLARGGEPGKLLLRPADGSVWLVQGSRMESFGEAGQRWVSQELPAPAVGVALSPDGERVWVATEGGVEARDAVSGEVEQRLVLPLGAGVAEPQELAVGLDMGLAVGPDGSVWIALAEEVAVYSPSGELRERLPLSGIPGPGIAQIAATEGGFWGARSGELVRWQRQESSKPGGETRSLAFQPFDGSRIHALAADPRGGVWVSAGSEVRRYDEAGNLLDAVDAGEPVRALVVGGPDGGPLPLPAEFADGWSSAAEGAGAGPEIDILGPEGFLQINPQDLPEELQIELAYSAGSAAVDLGSLVVRLDGEDITAFCAVTDASASCPAQPASGEELAEGEHLVTAEITDLSGRTASAHRAIWVLLGEGEHQVALPAVADSFIGRTLRNRNRGDAPYLQLRWAGRHRSLTAFDLSEVEVVLDSLQGARLELFIEHNAFNWGPWGREVDVHRLLEPWSEEGVTWTCAEDTNPQNFRPDCLVRWNGGVFDEVPSASAAVTSDQLGWVSFDVTADVAAALAGEESFGWLLKKRLEHRLGLVRFTSREGLWEQAPRLVLDFVGGEPELPDGPELPPDPVDIAPDLDRTVTYDLHSATEFLYTGDDPIQTGVEPGTLDPRRIAVLRGQVLDRDGGPLPGVTVAVLDHPEFGSTLSRADGWFDLAVNGGGILTLDYSKQGYLPIQRQVRAPWRDWAFADEAVLLPYDSVSTVITAGAADAQVARGSVQTDADGSRQATLVFPAGTTAEMELADGTVQPLPSLTLRATEYTVGPLGPDAMPGPLPPTVAYTYAVELSADEAEAAGAVEVRFSQPVYLYVENFLGFPVGERVPLGYWDRRQAAWVGAPNGRVVEVLGAAGAGRAAVDVDGSGQPADAAALEELSFTDGELERLAALYAPGTQLWRSPIPHLTPWDCNYPYAPPDDAVLPPGDVDDFDDWDDEDLEGPEDPLDPFGEAGDEGDGPEKDEDPCRWQGSVLECRDQVLGESLSLPGSELSLHYRSDRQAGRTAEYRLRTRVTTETPPGSLMGVELDIRVGGQRIRREFGPEPGQVFSFTWDGRDGYQRNAQGRVPVEIVKRYVYTGTYQSPATRRISWERFPEGSISPPPRSRTDSTIRLERVFSGTLESTSSQALGTFDARDLGLGGWSLSVHHVYDPNSRTLYLGDGSQRRASWLGPVLTRLAGTGSPGDGAEDAPAAREPLDSPSDVAVAPDGSVYIADTFNHKIRRIRPDGRMTTVAGTGEPCAGGGDDDDDDPTDGLAGPGGIEATAEEDCGDGGPAAAARLSAPEGVAVAADGTLLVADTGAGCVRRIDALGTIHTVAGQCRSGGDEDLAARGKSQTPARASNFSPNQGRKTAGDASIGEVFERRFGGKGPLAA
ncbi:MAG: DNRLRE domain-containing protein, partial [Acidobacteriota bacterium]|nr:DNRLRE domain-containing protein [Acidobacteriota bacterium]